jgi:hypothetical protein
MHPITEHMIPEVELDEQTLQELRAYCVFDRIELRGMNPEKVCSIFNITLVEIKRYYEKWCKLRNR